MFRSPDSLHLQHLFQVILQPTVNTCTRFIGARTCGCHPPLMFWSSSKAFLVFDLSREALAPFLKNEEARLMAESAAPMGPFQYILCASTSPAVKQQEESLTYLNQGKVPMEGPELQDWNLLSSPCV